MAIFIGRRPEREYTRVPNAWLRDPKISLKAKGLLAYLLSHRDGYRLTVDQVIAETTDRRDAVYAGLRELVDHGYVRREQRRGERGKVGEVDWYVVDAPDVTASGFSGSGESGSGDDQPEHDESAGQTASGFAVSGSAVSGESDTKKNRVKKTTNLEDQELSLTRPDDPPTAAAADRERDGSDDEPAGLEYRLIAARGVPADRVEPVRAWIAAQCGVRGPGWWITADRNGTLTGHVDAAVQALTAAARLPAVVDAAGPCGRHPWERHGGPCRPCAGEAKGLEPPPRIVSAADERVAAGAVLYRKYAALDAAAGEER